MHTSSQGGRRVVVVGAGMAAQAFAMRLSKVAVGRFDITLVGEEAHAPYDRVSLSAALADDATIDGLALAGAADYAAAGISLRLGCTVTSIDRTARTLTLGDGSRIGWDILVLACGSSPILPAIPGVEATGVHAFRTVADVTALIHAARPGLPAVVIGGGLLGIEAAHGLARRGLGVTVVHLASHLLERQLDSTAGALLAARLGRQGIQCLIGAQAQAFVRDSTGQVEGLAFADGSLLPAALVVIAIGVRPRTELARSAGLACERGILVDDALRTSDPSIHAIGECTQHRGRCYGLVQPVREQAEACAMALAGQAERYTGSSESTLLKVGGIGVHAAGRVEVAAGDEEIRLHDPVADSYRRLLVQGDRLVGAVLYGDTADAHWYARLIREATPIGSMRSELAFGQAFLSRPSGSDDAGEDPGQRACTTSARTDALAGEVDRHG